MKPLDPRLLAAVGQTRWFLAAAVATSIVATAGTLAVAFGLSQFVVAIFSIGTSLDEASIWLVIAIFGGFVRALASYLAELAGYRTARGTKAKFRADAAARLSKGGVGSDTGSLSQLLGPGLDALDSYFGKFLPQLIFTALITPFFIFVIWLNDPVSAVAIIVTLPLIPIFMVLIGMATRDLQQQQLSATTKLSSHFLEVLRGVTTLKIFNRVQKQTEILRNVSLEQKTRTMKVLRLSFLSGFALELAASLSVALIAVQIGLRLVEGTLEFAVGLFVLLLAPEVYLPLRNVGAQFHNSTAGVAATTELLDLLETPIPERVNPMPFAPGITVIKGPSGSGKSKMLHSLVTPESSWMPQELHLFAGTVAQNIAGFGHIDQKLLGECLALVGLEINIAGQLVAGKTGLSGGQAQRVALARALYRLMDKKLALLVLDEPTSMLDVQNQTAIAASLKTLAQAGIKIIVATHQQSLMEIADQVVELGVVHAETSPN